MSTSKFKIIAEETTQPSTAEDFRQSRSYNLPWMHWANLP